MKNSDLQKIIESAISKGCRFISILYRAKGTGELAKHTILLGATLENAYRKDIFNLKRMEFEGIKEVARLELLKSLEHSLDVGIGNNAAYTQKGKHESKAKGLRMDKESGICQIYGLQMRKIVIEKGVYKSVRSSDKTIAKNAIRKGLRSGKFRPYCVEAENLQSAKMNGRTLELA